MIFFKDRRIVGAASSGSKETQFLSWRSFKGLNEFPRLSPSNRTSCTCVNPFLRSRYSFPFVWGNQFSFKVIVPPRNWVPFARNRLSSLFPSHRYIIFANESVRCVASAFVSKSRWKIDDNPWWKSTGNFLTYMRASHTPSVFFVSRLSLSLSLSIFLPFSSCSSFSVSLYYSFSSIALFSLLGIAASSVGTRSGSSDRSTFNSIDKNW